METKGYQMAKNQERLKALARSDSKLEINLPRFFEQRFSGGENREQLMAEQEIMLVVLYNFARFIICICCIRSRILSEYDLDVRSSL